MREDSALSIVVKYEKDVHFGILNCKFNKKSIKIAIFSIWCLTQVSFCGKI